jgi:SAM-dependent methyltransferase
MTRLLSNPSSTHPAIVELRSRLDDFYAKTTNYLAFQATVQRDAEYALIDELLVDAIAGRTDGRARILELGAGRSGYRQYLDQHHPNKFQYDAQDVTASNGEYLRPLCDKLFIGDISAMQGEYDLILSTFVFEHISNPLEFLSHVKRLLAQGGWHVIFCPRYDWPGYVCPSMRHLSRLRQLLHSAWLSSSRLMSRLDRRPRFWVNLDPSMFHGPWFRDADAVHLVGRFDVEQWHRLNGFDVRRLYLRCGGMKEFILRRLLTLNLAARKR